MPPRVLFSSRTKTQRPGIVINQLQAGQVLSCSNPLRFPMPISQSHDPLPSIGVWPWLTLDHVCPHGDSFGDLLMSTPQGLSTPSSPSGPSPSLLSLTL